MPVASGRVAFSSRLIGVQKAKTQYTSWMTMLNKARPRTVRWGERKGLGKKGTEDLRCCDDSYETWALDGRTHP
jgi:hypothetical protein